jgi:hypothetical protein
MSIETVVHYISIAGTLSAGAFFIFKAGRWSREIESVNKHYHDLRNVVNALPAQYVSKEFYTLQMITLDKTLIAMNTQLTNIGVLQSKLLIAFGKLGGGVNDIS